MHFEREKGRERVCVCALQICDTFVDISTVVCLHAYMHYIKTSQIIIIATLPQKQKKLTQNNALSIVVEQNRNLFHSPNDSHVKCIFKEYTPCVHTHSTKNSNFVYIFIKM